MEEYERINALSDAAGLPDDVRQGAKTSYRRVIDTAAFEGRDRNVIIAGYIFIACRQCKTEIGHLYKAPDNFLVNSDEIDATNVAE